jgi:hypothetical protein
MSGRIPTSSQRRGFTFIPICLLLAVSLFFAACSGGAKHEGTPGAETKTEAIDEHGESEAAEWKSAESREELIEKMSDRNRRYWRADYINAALSAHPADALPLVRARHFILPITGDHFPNSKG